MAYNFKQIYRYILPVILILLTTLIKVQFTDLLGNRTPFLLYTGTVILATWFSGWVLGLITNAICVIIIVYFFLDPRESFQVLPHQYIHLSIFIVQNLIIVSLSYALETALKRSRQAELRFKLLVEQACDLLVLRDVAGKATYVSPKVTEIYGYTPAEYANLSFEKMIVPEFYEYFTSEMKEIMSIPDEHRVLKAQFIRKDGRVRWMEGDVYNYLHVEGINSIVSHIRDVTERVNLERQKDEFIGIASHELKTPITNIKGFTELAFNALSKNPEQASSFIDKSRYNIKRLQRLVNDLLDISKINKGELVYQMESFDFAGLITDTINNLAMNQKRHRILLEDLKPAIIKGDRIRLEQVLINLLENAIKYSPNSDKVVVRQELTENHVVISIQDFGIGISDQHLQNIFDRFYRVDNSSMRFQGLGLGLYIASQILKSHKGNLWVESKPEAGSTFYFLLPLKSIGASNVQTDQSSFYSDNHISIKLTEPQRILDVEWFGYQSKETVQQCGLKILEFVKKTNASLVLNDNSKVKGNWSESSEHGGDVWFPSMEKAGVTHFAWIQSEQKFSQMAALKTLELVKSGIQIKLFDNKSEARTWLNKVGA